MEQSNINPSIFEALITSFQIAVGTADLETGALFDEGGMVRPSAGRGT